MAHPESGLFLPIRFYKEKSEQDRYKRHSLGVALTELNYPNVDCVTLAPFQFRVTKGAITTSMQMHAYCADTNEHINIDNYLEPFLDEYNDGTTSWFSYKGDADLTGVLHNGLWYISITVVWLDGYSTVYSDLFRISNCEDTPYDVETFRSWADGDNLRAFDTDNLRIV